MTKRWWIIISIAAVAVLALLAGPGALTASGLEPAACATCHSMEEFRDTHAESKHAAVSCSECHIPHGADALPTKYEKGVRHVWATITGDANIQLKPEDEQILLDNCIACHVQTEHVSVPENRSCLNCHWDDPHGNRESRSW